MCTCIFTQTYNTHFPLFQVRQIRDVRDAALKQLSTLVQIFLKLPPVQQIQDLPTQVGEVANNLRELSRVLIQLLINTTPLYSMVRRTSSSPDCLASHN